MTGMETVAEIAESDRHLVAAPTLLPKDLLRLANGFSRLLWSIPFGLFLFTGTMDFAFGQFFRLPTYIFAVLLFYWGLTALHRVTPLSPAWKRYIRLALVLSFLMLYFAPFIFWWKRQPEQNHFAMNLFALLLAVTWMMWLVNKLAEEVAIALEDRVFLIETRLCGWAVLGFLLVPLSGFILYAMTISVRQGIPLFHIIEEIRFVSHLHWLLAFVLLPLTLTVSIAWKTKERAMEILKARADQSITMSASAPGRSG